MNKPFTPPIKTAIASVVLFSLALTMSAPPNYPEAGKAQGDVNGKGRAKTLAIPLAEKVGSEKGYAQGFNECADQHRRDIYNVGFGAGRVQGGIDGPVNGERDAKEAAARDGRAQGIQLGEQQADAAARQNAPGPGRQRGIEEANASNASAEGAKDGKAAGDIQARDTAVKTDYPAGRTAYRNERFAEAPQSETTIALSPGLTPTGETAAITPATSSNNFAALGLTSNKDIAEAAHVMQVLANLNVIIPNEQPQDGAELAIKYCKENAPNTPAPVPSPTDPAQPTPAPVNEYAKCIDEYKAAYDAQWLASFKAEYPAAYTERHNAAFERNRPLGCTEANRLAQRYRQNIDDKLNLAKAHADGYSVGYNEVYAIKYRAKYDAVYGPLVITVRNQMAQVRYSEVYDSYYAREFETARAQAYNAQRTALYNAAFAKAKTDEFNAKYPGYAKAENARGRADETAEFARVPVRLIKTSIQETIQDGILEASERIMVNFSVRNFSDQKINPADLSITARALDQSGVAIPGKIAVLPKALEPKSLTHVTGALDIRLNEAGYNRVVKVEVTWSVKNQVSATEVFSLRPQTLARVEIAEMSEVRLGYPGNLKIRVTNQSTKPLPEAASLNFQTTITGVVFSKTSEQLANPQTTTKGLAAGEQRLVDFPFVNNSYAGHDAIPFAATVKLASGRDVGLLNETRQVPSVQDYKFDINMNQLEDLRKKTGLFNSTNVPFKISNISSRIATQSLSVELKVEGPAASAISWPNGNLLTWNAIKPGFQSEGKVKAKVSKSNNGGTLVITVKEGGKLIGVIRQNF